MENKYTLEKLEIVKRLGAVEQELIRVGEHLKSLMEQGKTSHEYLADMVKSHHRDLYGVNGSPGIKISLDRVLQLEKNLSRHFWIIYGSLIVGFFKIVFDFIIGKKIP